MLANFYKSCVLSADDGVDPEAFTVLPVSDIEIMVKPWLRSKSPVVELVSGKRIMADLDGRFHVDVTITWEEMGPIDHPKLVAWIKNAWSAGSTSTYKFYPVADGAGPDSDYPGIEVVPEVTEGLIRALYEGKIRKREVELSLKGVVPLLASNVPFWALDEAST